MSRTAQREDIDDPAVVSRFAGLVGDQVHLDYLYVLTVADIRGTSPTLWNSWKDALLRELYHATRRAQRRGLDSVIDKAELIAETQEEVLRRLTDLRTDDPRIAALWGSLSDDYFLRHSPDEIARHARNIVYNARDGEPMVSVRPSTHRGGTEVFLYTRDRDYLFATTTSTLSQLGLTIVDARIFTTRQGRVLDTYIVLEEDGSPVADTRREQEIARALRENVDRLQGPPPPVARRVPRQLRHFPVPPQVLFREDRSNHRTVMEVIAADRPGLLARIAVAMNRSGVRLHNAKIATFGERAEDIFFVTDRENRPLDPEQARTVEREVLEALGEVGAGPIPA
jgi:[protein-PII] uridylyltransferase